MTLVLGYFVKSDITRLDPPMLFFEEELGLLEKAGVAIHRLNDILAEMVEKPSVVKTAAGADLYELMLLRK